MTTTTAAPKTMEEALGDLVEAALLAEPDELTDLADFYKGVIAGAYDAALAFHTTALASRDADLARLRARVAELEAENAKLKDKRMPLYCPDSLKPDEDTPPDEECPACGASIANLQPCGSIYGRRA